MFKTINMIYFRMEQTKTDFTDIVICEYIHKLLLLVNCFGNKLFDQGGGHNSGC